MDQSYFLTFQTSFKKRELNSIHEFRAGDQSGATDVFLIEVQESLPRAGGGEGFL